MDVDWTHQLIEQLDWHWRTQLRPRMDGLTDDEYRWEPVAGCWSLRPRSAATTPMAAGAGEVVVDFAFPEPDPPPFTTIAWRMAHLSIGVFGMRAANHFGKGGVSYETTEWPLDAAGGLALLDHWHARWHEGVRALSPAQLAQPVGPAEGPFADRPLAELVLHINREAIHHGAEIALLRDLWPRRDDIAGAGARGKANA